MINSLVDECMSFNDGHNSVQSSGKHIVFGVQHELTIQTDVFAEHWPVMLHGCKIEQRLAGAQ
jgi:hypothetical protein